MLGIIMAGGQGTRLMPLTATRPKPMVEVLGRPVIDFVKDAMVEAGIDEIVVTTGYRGEQLDAHVASWNANDGFRAWVNQESTPMGTAGSVGLLRDRVNGTCVVGSGDAIASFDIKALLKVHRANKAKVTMALWQVDDPSEFGIVGLAARVDGEVDGQLRQGFIRRFQEKPPREEAFSNVINAGLYILEPEVFDHIPVGEKFDFSKQLFPTLLQLGWPLYASTIDGVWFDVGQPAELLKAQQTLLEQHHQLPFQLPTNHEVRADSMVSKHATINGVLDRSMVSQGCVIEGGAHVLDSMLMEGVVIGQGSTVARSVLGKNVQIPPGCTVEDCVVGDDERLGVNGVYIGQKIP